MHRLTLLTAIILLTASACEASTLIIDSFTSGYAIILLNGEAMQIVHPGPIGTSRFIGASVRLTPAQGSTSALANSPADGSISYYGEGHRLDSSPVNAIISYRRGGPYSLSDYSALTFDFSDVIGEGLLTIDMGFGSTSVTVNEPGVVTIPFSAWITPPNNNLSVSNFYALNIEWQNISYASGFTLREIAAIQPAIPEPANYAALTTLVALSACMLRRSRRHLR